MGHIKLVNDNPYDSYPSFLKKIINKTSGNNQDSKSPILIRMTEPNSEDDFNTLLLTQNIYKIIDNYAEQFAELVLSRNAHLYRANHEVQVESIAKLLDEHYGSTETWKMGSWVFYPWSGELVHLLDRENFEDLRSIRNRDLINKQEQSLLSDFNATCFGMSVGSAGALALGVVGASRRIKLVDGAVVSGSNLNRILTGVSSVGIQKSEVISRKLHEMNPYMEIGVYDKVDESNINAIFDSKWNSNVIIDEIDDIEMKVKLRVEARKRAIPVLMATEIGDTVILDVERFDIDPKRQLFHGIVPNIEDLLDRKVENQREWMKHAVNIIGPKNMHIKMQESLLKIGASIVTHPQLGPTVMMTGGILATAVKYLALNQPMDSGRYVISLEKLLLSDHQKLTYQRAHRKHTKVINRAIDSM